MNFANLEKALKFSGDPADPAPVGSIWHSPAGNSWRVKSRYQDQVRVQHLTEGHTHVWGEHQFPGDMVRAAPEQEAFETAIETNPLDSTAHLAYSDWLDEQGHADEAQFRRAVGGWIADNSDDPPIFTQNDSGVSSRGQVGLLAQGYTHGLDPSTLPTDWRKALQTGTSHQYELPDHVGRKIDRTNRWVHYRGYRNLEQGLRLAYRKAFQRGKKK